MWLSFIFVEESFASLNQRWSFFWLKLLETTSFRVYKLKAVVLAFLTVLPTFFGTWNFGGKPLSRHGKLYGTKKLLAEMWQQRRALSSRGFWGISNKFLKRGLSKRWKNAIDDEEEYILFFIFVYLFFLSINTSLLMEWSKHACT